MSTVKSLLPTPRVRISRRRLRKFSWLPDILRVEGSIIGRILGPVLTVTIFATGVAYLWSLGHDVHLTNSVVPVVAVVVGLILVFRNGTSYDRYYEGRKDWGALTAHVRNLTRLIWINVALPPPDAANPNVPPGLTAAAVRKRKARAVRLCLAFVVATKHYLRGEDGVSYPDLQAVLPPSFARWDELGATTSDGVGIDIEERLEAHSTRNATKRVRAKRSNPTLKGQSSRAGTVNSTTTSGTATPTAKTPLLSSSQLTAASASGATGGDSFVSGTFTAHTTVSFHAHADLLSLPLPLALSHEIARAIFLFKRDGLLETVGPAGTNAMNGLLQGMVDMMTGMERIANTPIPQSYRIHLKQAVGLYLFALPFTLIQELGWGMIPIVTVVAFTFMGIEGIADEIEMPFGSDKSDLPLDTYCADLKEEIDYLLERLPEGGEGMQGFDDGEGDD